MKIYTFDLSKVNTERDYWDSYLKTVNGEGSEYFGKNIYAFRDSILSGGPGCPEYPSKFVFQNSNPEKLKLLKKIFSVLEESDKITIEIESI